MNIATITSNDVERFSCVLATLRYKRGWSFEMHGDGGWSPQLKINVDTVNSDDVRVLNGGLVAERTLISHRFLIPPWMLSSLTPITRARMASTEEIEDWIFDRIVDVERHEAGEFFRIRDTRPYQPQHGPGANPYDVRRREKP